MNDSRQNDHDENEDKEEEAISSLQAQRRSSKTPVGTSSRRTSASSESTNQPGKPSRGQSISIRVLKPSIFVISLLILLAFVYFSRVD